MDEDDEWATRTDFLTEVMLATYERRRFQTEFINEMPLYPTERLLWDENQVPSAHYTGPSTGGPSQAALPRLPFPSCPTGAHH